MDVNAILDTLISHANADQSTLEDLIAWLQTQILVSDSPNQTPPDVDENGVWTLSQSTANVDGEYEGVYRLPAASACGKLEIVSIVNLQNPATAAPARLKGCVTEEDPDPVFTDLASVNALDGECFNAFAIRSSAPFEVQVRVSECVVNCPDELFLQTGTLFDHPDDHTWIIDSAAPTPNPDGRQSVTIYFSADFQQCCCITEQGEISGYAPASYWTDCHAGEHYGGAVNGRCATYVSVWNPNGNPFRYRFVTSPCGNPDASNCFE